MQSRLTTWLPLAILAMLGILAGLGRVLESGGSGEHGSMPVRIAVTSAADRGPGSLRAALFQAIRAPHHVTIDIEVARIALDIGLPPLAATAGMTIRGTGETPATLGHRGDFNATDVILDVAGDDVTLSNLAIDAAGATGIIVRGARTTIEGVELHNGTTGLAATDPERLTLRRSLLRGNRDGLRLEGHGGGVLLDGNRFEANHRTGAWIVFSDSLDESAGTVAINDNRFDGGRDALVAANVLIDVRGNSFTGFSNNGITLISSRAMVSANRIVDSDGIGVHATALRASFITDNEIGRNRLVGLLVIDADGLQVDSNQFYGNGYGVAVVGREPITAALRNNTLVDHTIDGLIAIGDTPLIDGNHALRNRKAGIRILDLLLPGRPVITASRRHANNVLNDNGDDTVQYGEYRVTSL